MGTENGLETITNMILSHRLMCVEVKGYRGSELETETGLKIITNLIYGLQVNVHSCKGYGLETWDREMITDYC